MSGVAVSSVGPQLKNVSSIVSLLETQSRTFGQTSSSIGGSLLRSEAFLVMSPALVYSCVITTKPFLTHIISLYGLSPVFANSCLSTTPITPTFNHSMVKPLPLIFVIITRHFLPYSSSMRCESVDATRLNLSLQSFLVTCLGKTGFRRAVSLMTPRVLSFVVPLQTIVMTTMAALCEHSCPRR